MATTPSSKRASHHPVEMPKKKKGACWEGGEDYIADIKESDEEWAIKHSIQCL